MFLLWTAPIGSPRLIIVSFFDDCYKLYRACLLKENLRLALKAGPDEIAGALTKWMAWAQRCRIPVFRELRKKIKRHFDAIVAAARFRLSNARSEAINNKIKLIIRTAFGFRNVDTFSLWLCSPAPIFIQSSSHSPEPLTRPLFLPKSPFFQYGSCIMQANRLY